MKKYILIFTIFVGYINYDANATSWAKTVEAKVWLDIANLHHMIESYKEAKGNYPDTNKWISELEKFNNSKINSGDSILNYFQF